jgi:hypothetical protein
VLGVTENRIATNFDSLCHRASLLCPARGLIAIYLNDLRLDMLGDELTWLTFRDQAAVIDHGEPIA